MADEITESDIVDAALAPESATADGQSVTARPISDLIKAKNAGALAGGTSAWGCLRPARFVPPASTGPNDTTSTE